VQAIVDFFERYADEVPLELFVLLGTFIEELFSPIPSFVVLVPAGAVAEAQGMGVWYLAWLMLFSAVGRIAGAIILYKLADKVENRLLTHGRRFFGISHKEIEQFGQRLGRAGRRDWAILFLMNAVPIFPAAVLSLACGFVKVQFRMFVLCTFFGTMVNALIYMGIGYAGFRTAATLRNIEIVTQIVIGFAIVAVIAWIVRKQHQRRRARRQSANLPRN
jgi:membrane protein DedA with SNARE-associated domain